MTSTVVTDREPSSPLVETDWLYEHLDDSDLRILDCSVMYRDGEAGKRTYFSGEEHWARGHVPGSVFVDFLADLNTREPIPFNMPPVDEFAEKMESIGVGDDNRVVLYDNSNHAWAARVWWMLRVIGFDGASVLNGGLQKWTAEGRPVSTEATRYPRGVLTVRHRPELMVDKRRILSSLNDDGVTLINALTPAEYRGTVNRFPRAGRIANSVNVDCESLVDPDTRAFLPNDELRAIFRSVGALSGNRVITYCGGGVAASADALALTMLGVQGVAVYDGGLIEWTADPAVPMETG